MAFLRITLPVSRLRFGMPQRAKDALHSPLAARSTGGLVSKMELLLQTAYLKSGQRREPWSEPGAYQREKHAGNS